MTLFGPKALCSHCGKKVPKPKDPNQFLCPHCGSPGPWASTEQVARWEVALTARKRYTELLEEVASPKGKPDLATLNATARDAWYRPGEGQQLLGAALQRRVEAALVDDLLSELEEAGLIGVTASIGLDWREFLASHDGLSDRVAIAQANSGRLPTLAASRLLVKQGEIVHGEFPASLMKEVTLREYRAGYAGLSVPLGRSRTRIHFGGVRGHSVVTGTQLKVSDSGTLVITSQRVVFLGATGTSEMAFAKLANFTMFSDGIQVHLTNRERAPLFRVRNGELVAAIVNAALHARPPA